MFAEVADGFSQFIDDGIFVAHGVNFDYRFYLLRIRASRTALLLPKLCTCAGMRRRYPGQKSWP